MIYDDEISHRRMRSSVDSIACLERFVETRTSRTRRARAVPVTFRGAARDVRLMGDFDDWTRGFRLTPDRGDDDDRDDVFSCVCALPPGTYQVKFLIDDEEWRTTEDWETVGDGYERNMVLRVE